MKLYYHDQFVLPLPADHRFPMRKYAALRERIEATSIGAGLEVGPSCPDSELELAHDQDYIRRVRDGELTAAEIRRIGFPWSPGLVERSRRSVGSTVAACRSALSEGVSVNLAGGTHHAFRAMGQGYCVFNDAAVGARTMQRFEGVGRVLIFDCDVHQGNGTAEIFTDDPTVFTVSLHGATNFPFEKEQSDLDVPLADGTNDQAYLTELERALDRAFAAGPFDLAIYVSGADPFELDKLGKLSLTKEGLRGRDERVLDYCERSHTPVAVSMAGGYAASIDDIVDIHFQTVATAHALYERRQIYSRESTLRP